MGFLLIFIKVITGLWESVFVKQYNRKHTHGGMFFTGIISLFAMLFFLLSDTNGFHIEKQVLPYAALFGLIYCVAYLLTFYALAIGSFTMSLLIISYALVFPIVYGIIWLHDPVSVFTYIGFALLAISLFLVRGKKDAENKRFSMKWLIAILIVAIGNGALAVIQKVQQLRFDNKFNNEFMAVALGLSAAVLLIGGIIKDRKYLKEILRYGTPYAGGAGVANGINNLLTLFINNMMPIAISSPLVSGSRIVFSFIISRTIFKEQFLVRQIIGVAIGALALVFLNL